MILVLALVIVEAGGWWLTRNELSSLQADLDAANVRIEEVSAAAATPSVSVTTVGTRSTAPDETPAPPGDYPTRSDLDTLDQDMDAAFAYLDDLALRQQDLENIVRRSPEFEAVRQLLEDSVVYVETESGSGSGFRINIAPGCTDSSDCDLYEAEGYNTMILTNYHVIAELSDTSYEDRIVTIYAKDGSSAVGRVWDWDVGNDLAAIDLDASDLDVYLAPLLWAAPDDTTLGDPVAVGGHPFGLDFVMSTGHVTGKDADGWEVDAIISQGNSGGPVVNAFGRVFGVATSTLGGITYATDIERVCDRILDC